MVPIPPLSWPELLTEYDRMIKRCIHNGVIGLIQAVALLSFLGVGVLALRAHPGPRWFMAVLSYISAVGILSAIMSGYYSVAQLRMVPDLRRAREAVLQPSGGPKKG